MQKLSKRQLDILEYIKEEVKLKGYPLLYVRLQKLLVLHRALRFMATWQD